jgi:hypothetical protein
LIQKDDVKVPGQVPDEILQKGYFDAFYLELFGNENSSVKLKRNDERRKVFDNIISNKYNFITNQKAHQKCSNNYFLTGNESEDLLEIFRVLHFDRVKYGQVPSRMIPDFHIDSLLKYNSVDYYSMILEDPSDEKEESDLIKENNSFQSLSNNPSFVCLDVVEEGFKSEEKKQINVYFVLGNEGSLKQNFLKEIENIFKGNNR